jgi:hypothetical protein
MKRQMMLREWQLWHTYASYFTRPLPSLESVAANLVKWSIAECAVTSDGLAWWNNDDVKEPKKRTDRRRNTVGHGKIVFEASHDRREARIVLPDGIRGYAAESVMQWAWARQSENLLFGEGPLPPRYVLAKLGVCVFKSSAPHGVRLGVYPELKIYDSGVIIVQFRMFSPDSPIAVPTFVDTYVNASLAGFEYVLVPPGIVAWAPMASPEDGIFRFYRRPYTAFTQWRHQRVLEDHVRVEDFGDFEFELVSLTLPQDYAFASAAIKRGMPELRREITEAMRSRAARHGIVLASDLSYVGLSSEAGSQPDRITDTIAEDSKHPGSRNFNIEHIKEDVVAAGRQAGEHFSRKLRQTVQPATARSPETFQTVALLIMEVVGYVASTRTTGPCSGLRMAIAGPGTINHIGAHWTGRPNTHLFRFSDQASSAEENLTRHSDAFGAIATRTSILEGAKRWLPEDTREFDDYSAHIGLAGSLWVHSRRSLDRRGPSHGHINRALLVYEQQTKVELLEYGYMLHRRIADRVMQGGGPYTDRASELLEAQRDLADFEWSLQDTGHFGEVRNQLEAGWAAFGIPRLRQRIADALRVRQEAASYRQSLASTRWSAFLALVAGLLAVPPLVDILIDPLWKLFDLPRPASAEVYALFLALVGFGAVGILLLVGYTWARRVRLPRF